MKVYWQVAKPLEKTLEVLYMKAIIIQLWALLCLIVQLFFEFLGIAVKEAGELLDQCGIELSMRNFLMSLFYFAVAYLFVISVWIVLI